ncbi:unnamed protein product [Mytilus edulis]|uniref:Uncharacterized protein n=2 Tax=Mytilus TaxID=6548 RepID=A0A8S3TG92_MYTED|nr:unnamed protein product [Mytilus edulis]
MDEIANFEESDWQNLKDQYKSALKAKSERLNDKKKKDLIQLDLWFQEELPKNIQGRKEKHITHDELCKLMKWKLTRGKFRPRLEQMVKENSEEDVLKASKKAFSVLPNVSEAIKALSVLRAIGPATASAVLAAGAPKHAAFMADESMLALPGLKPLAYTPAFYARYMDQVKGIVKQLNKEASVKWTPHDVEIALWTYYTLKTLEPDMLKTAIKRKAEKEEKSPVKQRRRKKESD